jgi:lysophospholipase L1-like esterase
MRLPGDTWQMAAIPVGVRLEIVGDAWEIEIEYSTRTDQLGYRGAGAGTMFSAWTSEGLLAEAPAVLGESSARLPLAQGQPTIVYLPEGMRPTVQRVSGVGGDIAPAPAQPRWVVYGDSVAEGWIASAPALAWPAIAGREQRLDVVNLGYAGAARGETASAEQVAGLSADLITVCHGTNCWTRTPHSVGVFRETVTAFLDVIRQDHPTTPLLVASPVVRPDAEKIPNRLGATLADLRGAMEDVVQARIDAGDEHLQLVRGLELLDAEHLGDGIHPDDQGHRRMAAVLGQAARSMIRAR